MWTACKIALALAAGAGMGAWFGAHWEDREPNIVVGVVRRMVTSERWLVGLAVIMLALAALVGLVLACNSADGILLGGVLGIYSFQGRLEMLWFLAMVFAVGFGMARDDARSKRALESSRQVYLRRVQAGEIEPMENPPPGWETPDNQKR